tara:strand:- start:468 stop:650 length:183 start_codon:yes stop_codon:yes gene_type:complete
MAALIVVLSAGTPIRLDTDCPECGWADLWQIPVHSLSHHGVGTVAIATWCLRCQRRMPTT